MKVQFTSKAGGSQFIFGCRTIVPSYKFHVLGTGKYVTCTTENEREWDDYIIPYAVAAGRKKLFYFLYENFAYTTTRHICV